MLIKAYLRRHMFHLPMKENELLNQVEKELNKPVNKSVFGKIYPVTKIEDNENILIEGQKTNIFLLNLLLLVLNHNETDITEPGYYNGTNIISRLEEETKLNLKGPFEEVEKEVGNYLNPTSYTPQIETEKKEEKEKNPYLKNVEFRVGWLKGAQKEVDLKWIQQQKNKNRKKS